MKRAIVIFTLILIVILVPYFILDKKLYFYGKSTFGFYNNLPFKIKPVFNNDFEGGIALEDENGFFIISRGKYQYFNSQFKFNFVDFVKYGYTKDKLSALVLDENGKYYFIECSIENDFQTDHQMVVKVFDDSVKLNFDKYKWIFIKDRNISKLESIKGIIEIIIVLLILSIIYLVYKTKQEFSLNGK